MGGCGDTQLGADRVPWVYPGPAQWPGIGGVNHGGMVHPPNAGPAGVTGPLNYYAPANGTNGPNGIKWNQCNPLN